MNRFVNVSLKVVLDFLSALVIGRDPSLRNLYQHRSTHPATAPYLEVNRAILSQNRLSLLGNLIAYGLIDIVCELCVNFKQKRHEGNCVRSPEDFWLKICS